MGMIILVAILVLLTGIRILDARRQHRELMDLLNDFATMVGEGFFPKG